MSGQYPTPQRPPQQGYGQPPTSHGYGQPPQHGYGQQTPYAGYWQSSSTQPNDGGQPNYGQQLAGYAPPGALEPLAGRARTLLICAGIATVGMVMLNVSMAGMTEAAIAGGDLNGARLFVLGLGLILLLGGMIGGFVGTGLWLSRARANADILNPGARHTLSPGFAWGGWIIPIASLVLPLLFVLDVRKAVNPNGSKGVTIGWWVCWAMSGTVSSIASRVDPDSTTGLGVAGTIVYTVLFVASYALLIPMVRTLTREQEAAIAQRQQPAWH